MRGIFIFCWFILSINTVKLYAQQVGSVNFDKLKDKVAIKNATFSYDDLVQRYLALDSTLTDDDFYVLYYGSIFTRYYQNLGDITEEKEFYGYFNSADYASAIKQGIKILKDDPFNMRITFKVVESYFLNKDTIAAQRFGRRYFPIIKTILSTGDGKSEKTAFVVLRVSDEYEVLGELHLRGRSQSLAGSFDVLSVEAPNDLNVQQVYFNIEKELEEEDKLFQKK